MADDVEKRVCIVVLGDWGRSPRMQYHALSLARNGFMVDVVAYKGANPHEAVKNHKCIAQHYLRKVPKFENYFPKLFVYILKTLWQSLFLFTLLLSLVRSDVMLMQNPPSIPTLPICWFVCWLRKTKFMIDYHNYGFTILALSAGKSHILVKMCKWCEKYFGQKAAHNLCVTQAMQEDLAVNWNIRATVFYDCPPEIFHPISIEDKHAFFLQLSECYSVFKARSEQADMEENECTRFTVKKDNTIEMSESRPPLIISSTSWTEDEDFSILLDALVEYEKTVILDQGLPDLIVVITGKGPLKHMYEQLIKEKDFRHVEILTMWLAAENYPTILACADLGICLHRSTSGLDLPMKVVDMFGSCLPVCAFYYSCVDELVKAKVNGLCFTDSKELLLNLKNLLKGFPQKSEELKSYRENLKTSPLPRWDVSWNERILPIVNDLAG